MIRKLLLPGVALVALATCATAPTGKFYARGICEADAAKSPDAMCTAGYTQQWGVRTLDPSMMVIISCKSGDNRAAGVGAVAYGEHSEHGVALRWLANDRLEIGLPAGVSPSQPDMGPDGSIQSRKPGRPSEMTPVADGRVIRITYRDLTPKDREWNHSCFKTRPKVK